MRWAVAGSAPRPHDVSEPLFILAPPRSFTSVVCAMIGQHPQMVGLPETNLFAAETIRALQAIHRSRPRFAHGLLRSVAQLGLGGQTVSDVDAAQRWLDEHRELDTAAVFRDLMDWASPRRVIDKSPMYIYAPGALQRLIAAFPNAFYLHLTRHPRATCESIYETRTSAKGNAEGGALARDDTAMTPTRMWLEPHLRIRDALEAVPEERRMLVRGESLMIDPWTHLKRIAEWLGIRTDDAAIESMMHPEKSPFACLGPENARLGNDPRFLQSPGLRPYREKPSDLDSALSWDPDLVFDDTLKLHAIKFGY
jgi:hypothetical protein